MSNSVNYIQDGFILAVKRHPLWWQQQGLTYTATGYGSNIPSDLVAYCADGKRRRIRSMVFSNSGSSYLIVKGERRFIRDHQIPAVTP